MNKVENRNKFRESNLTKFEPSKWENFQKAGCYNYALDIFDNRFFLVGSFIGNICNDEVENKTLISTLKKELEEIFDYEVEEIDVSQKAKKGERKIYLQRCKYSGYYHFLREDDNGIWSHKYVNQLPKNVDRYGRNIEKPDMIEMGPNYGWCFLLRKKKSV